MSKRFGLGLLAYGGAELYLHWRTQAIVQQRNTESTSTKDADSNDTKFRSATVAGMFINPFKEYRPQTGFEYLFVRLLEVGESLYGNVFEVHQHVKDDTHTVEDYLHIHKPKIDLMKQNSILFQEKLKSGNYKTYFGFNRPNDLLFTWLGQSCCLLQVSGVNILTDPILSDHLLTPKIGPKRLNKSPMDFNDIQNATNNKLDFIMVSHDHPDHLEMDLVSKFGNKSTWIVPMGMKKPLARRGVYNIIEMDWWDKVDVTKYITDDKLFPDKYEVVCVPSMHWSGRYVVDANKSLWCSYILRKNDQSLVYHAGDTGYVKDLFEEIGLKYGPVQLSLLPIGQYCPSWHQKPRHISPQESLDICKHMNSKYMMGIHWGTFKLSSEPILEPKSLLTKLCKHKPNYKAPEFGLTYELD